MKLKILSDGTVAGTMLVDAETGELVRQTRRVDWWCDGSTGTVMARVMFEGLALEAVTETADAPDKVTLLQMIALWAQGVPWEKAKHLPWATKIAAMLNGVTQLPEAKEPKG